MTDDQRAKLLMYHRVHGVVTKYVVEFPAPHAPDLLAGLATNNNDIHSAGAAQEVGTGPTTAKRGQERTKLVKMLTKIENTRQVIGAALNDAATVPQFSLDPAFSQMADEELITSADALKTAATPLGAEFQSRGFAATFLADLQTQRDAFHNAVPAGSTVTLAATRTGNNVTGTVTLSRAVQAGDTVLLRWREQGSAGPFATGPITTLLADATSASVSATVTSASASVTVTTANPVEVVARVILSSGSQFDSATVVV